MYLKHIFVSDEMQENLKSAEVELEKKDKELQRLREHLIQVEDTYIKEAIEAGIFNLIYNILFCTLQLQ